jgi:hypothetical protein
VAPVSAGAGTLGHPYATYLPSMVEIAILFGAGAVMALGYTLAERYLDMGEGDTHMFFAWPWLKRHAHPGREAGVGDAGTPVRPAQPGEVAAATATAMPHGAET